VVHGVRRSLPSASSSGRPLTRARAPSWWIYYIGPGIGSIATSLIVWFLWGSVRPPSHFEEQARDDRIEDEPIKSDVV